jgi:hypothetical protein
VTIINPTMPTPGDARGAEEIDLANALQALLADYNGSINADNIAAGAIGTSELAVPAAWTAVPSYAAGWSDYDSAGFYKDLLGIVHLRGEILRSGSASVPGELLFILPPGYRPAFRGYFPVLRGGGGGLGGFTALAVEADGEVRVSDFGSGVTTPQDGEVVNLAPISFKAA